MRPSKLNFGKLIVGKSIVGKLILASLLAVSFSTSTIQAQTTDPAKTTPPAKHKPNPYASPLDTIMSTHLWTTVPPAEDFVREARPAAKDLAYTPLTGKDPDRPKPRDKANIAALQAELEQSGAHNEARAQGLRGPLKTRRAKAKALAK